MAKTIHEQIAEALDDVSKSSVGNIVHSKNINPRQQALLVKNGFLKRIIKGWYLLDADLSAQNTGESALWYESLWSFIAQYLTNRFEDNYWLSPEASLDIHTHTNSIPAQIVVFVKDGTEDITQLPNSMSIIVTRSKEKPEGLVKYQDINVFSLEAALAKSVPAAYRTNPVSMQVALRSADPDKLTEALVILKNASSAGRIIGGYDAIGMRAESKKLETVMQGIFGKVNIVDPFDIEPIILGKGAKAAPSAIRIRIMWEAMREDVIKGFSGFETKADFFSQPLDETLKRVNELYVNDAYNSLSIEGYVVTPELIKKVSSGDWSPETVERDNETKNALAARGYFDAFNNVKKSLEEAFNKEDLEYLVDVGITQWQTALFKPCVTASLIRNVELAGFRKGPIIIRGSMHVPPASEQLMDCMTALKECIAKEESFAVKTILGHLFLGYIHPFFDGNGRTARFLMNFLFVVGGYEWVIIKQESRAEYMAALEAASVDKNIKPFVEFILSTIKADRP